jgi:hypothetical protein
MPFYANVILRLCASISARWWAEGKRNGMFKHGLYTKEAVQKRRLLRELLRQSCGALVRC